MAGIPGGYGPVVEFHYPGDHIASSGSTVRPFYFLAAKIRPPSPADSKFRGKTEIDDITECTAAFCMANGDMSGSLTFSIKVHVRTDNFMHHISTYQ